MNNQPLKLLVFSFFFLILSLNNLIAQCDFFDECQEITEVIQLSTNDTFEINYLCIEACLEGASPELAFPGISDCGFTERPSIWFEIVGDDMMEQFYISASAIGWQPIWTVYTGASCDDLMPLTCSNNMSPECSDWDDTPYISVHTASNLQRYFLLLSSDRNLSEADDSSFEVCISSTVKPMICSGTEEVGCIDSLQSYEVVDREFAGELSGPFLAGEQLTICFDYFYDATLTGADWMMALLPSFGSNWDLSSFNTNVGLTGEWFETDGDCAPLIQESVNYLCTYIDSHGQLRLCNALCEVCPCELGIAEGEALPSGWYWVSPGGNSECENNCSPGEGWGAGTTTFQFNFCMDLRIKEDPDYSDPYGLQILMN